MQGVATRSEQSERSDVSRDVLVRAVRWEADGIISMELEPVSEPLPHWEPGSHIDVVVADGSTRQYSLCGAVDRQEYRIAVLRESDGRGGSEHLHRGVRPGDTVSIKGPRNHFPLEAAASYLLIAGGIGITPMIPMAQQLVRDGAQWQAVYYGRRRSRMAFIAELESFGDRVRTVVSDEGQRLPLAEVLDDLPEGALCYVCGPARMLDEARELMAERGLEDRLRTELFHAPESTEPPANPDTFSVELRSTGVTVTVGPDESVLEAVRGAGADVTTDCEEGICGSCETRVLEGQPDHRDSVLTAQERAANDCMMVCVSRAARGCPKLVLDL